MFDNDLSYDLRKGNYVLRNGKHISQVTSILGDTIFTNFPGKQFIDPIPLTPEWAEKLGFKYFRSRSGKNTRTWYKDHFFIYFGKKNGPKMNNKFKLPYVHNLQNLWWEMKKTPLQIEE